jgi:hypothetical protein
LIARQQFLMVWFNFQGIFVGSTIVLARPDGTVTFTRLPKASTSYYVLFRLLRASAVQKVYRRYLVSRYFSSNNPASKYMYLNCSKAVGCRAGKLLRRFRRNLRIFSEVTTTPGRTRVQLISQEINAAAVYFAPIRQIWSKATCGVSGRAIFYEFFGVYNLKKVYRQGQGSGNLLESQVKATISKQQYSTSTKSYENHIEKTNFLCIYPQLVLRPDLDSYRDPRKVKAVVKEFK